VDGSSIPLSYTSVMNEGYGSNPAPDAQHTLFVKIGLNHYMMHKRRENLLQVVHRVQRREPTPLEEKDTVCRDASHLLEQSQHPSFRHVQENVK
jgi:hypothetical protein